MFGRRKDRPAKAWEEKVSVKIFRVLYRLQCRWAAWMDARVNRLSGKAKMALLLAFSLLMISISVLVALTAVTGKRKISIDTKLHLPHLEDHQQQPGTGLPVAVMGRIKRYKAYLDSLGTTATGQKTRDSLLRARPGLLDSIRSLEKVYELPKTNQ
nr:hypothetical protein [Pedobacter sp. ASV19]